LAARTASSEPSGARFASFGAALFGLLSAVTMPIAIASSRWFERYDLVQSAFAIPLAVALALVALSFASADERASSRTLKGKAGRGTRVGRVLAGLGLALAASGLVAIAVYGILTYLGDR
jgi:hypothetical protein